MNKLLIILVSLILVGCTNIPNPKFAFGKKCVEKGDQVHYSYVWIYNKDAGLQANEEACSLIDTKK